MNGWAGSATDFHSNSSEMPVTVCVASTLVPGPAPESRILTTSGVEDVSQRTGRST